MFITFRGIKIHILDKFRAIKIFILLAMIKIQMKAHIKKSKTIIISVKLFQLLDAT